MKTTYVSTQTMSNSLRRSVADIQAELARRQQELTSGRAADVGLTLGARTSQDVTLRLERASLQATRDANAIADSRLSAAQSMLTAMAGTANGFMDNLLESKPNATNAATLAQAAGNWLGDFISTLNTAHDGEYLFGGLNTGAAPVADYFGDPPSAAKQAVDAAFQTRFGMSQSDPAVSTISAADLEDFLNTDFAALFDDAGWADWSSASDEAIRSRISSAEQVTTGGSANDASVRKLAMALTMVADLGTAGLSGEAYDALISKASGLAGAALQGFTASQAQLGSSQEAVKNANDRIAAQMDVLATHIGSLETVDPYETATRVNDLTTQLETAYALTGRLQQLSLLDYL